MSEEETKVETVAEATATDDAAADVAPEAPAPKKGKKKWPIVVGIVVVVLIAAGAGFWVWHEQPSFCNAICHTPMDEYLVTYEQKPNTTGVDKWGNEVENTSSMLAVTHAAMGDTCMSCHVPTLSEQVSEGIAWISGNYEVLETQTGAMVPTERELADLTAARGTEADTFCLNESCHNMTRDDLIEATSDMDFNPHVAQHGERACSDCHKAHRASVLVCTQCHSEAEAPTGWLTVKEEKELAKAA